MVVVWYSFFLWCKIIQQAIYLVPTLGVQVRNMKMVFNIYGDWRRVMFEKLMMEIYDFFIQLSRLVTPYNIV